MKTVLAILTLTSLALGQETQTLSEKNARKLDGSETAAIWSQIPIAKSQGEKSAITTLPGVAPQQAPIIIEVMNLGETFRVTWRSIGGTAAGTTLAFRILPPSMPHLPGSNVLTMDSWQTSVYQAGYEFSGDLWDGKFPSPWPSGWTKFEVVMIPPGGTMLYASATVAVRACCQQDGPLERVDISRDGSVISLIGIFQGKTYATLAGQTVGISFSPEGSPWYTTGKIYNPYGNNQMVLTICSGGSCSTRVLYITRPGKG